MPNVLSGAEEPSKRGRDNARTELGCPWVVTELMQVPSHGNTPSEELQNAFQISRFRCKLMGEKF